MGDRSGNGECRKEEVVRGRIGPQAVRLVVTGPGIANTVHGLTAALAAGRPGLILQTGCGGGFGQAGIRPGDIAIASCEIDAQFGREDAGAKTGVSTLSFPVINRPEPEIFNRYPVDAGQSERALEILGATFGKSRINVLKGPFVTVSTVTTSAGRSDSLYHRYGALIENMEGVGAAHVAALYDIPFLEIRAVSNPGGCRG